MPGFSKEDQQTLFRLAGTTCWTVTLGEGESYAQCWIKSMALDVPRHKLDTTDRYRFTFRTAILVQEAVETVRRTPLSVSRRVVKDFSVIADEVSLIAGATVLLREDNALVARLVMQEARHAPHA